MIFLSVEDVIDFHTEIINDFGGLHGIRDMGLLISAIEMPKATFIDEDLHLTASDKAAAYLFHIIANHPFVDGNKRTATVAALTFFIINGIHLSYDQFEIEELIIGVAKGHIKKDKIASFFEKAVSPNP